MEDRDIVENSKKNNKNINISLIIIPIIIVLLAVAGITYAFFAEDFKGERTTSIKAGKNLTFKYNETSEGLVSVSEMSDSEGINQDNYFDFDVVLTADNETSINYIIYLTKTEGSLDNSAVKVYLTDQANAQIKATSRISDLSDYSSEANSKILYTNSISGTDVTHSYRLRAWVDENYEGSSSGNINNITDGVNITTTSENYKFKVNVKIADKSFLSSEILKQGIVSEGYGLYVSTATNDGRPTYYYHGAVENNYVDFAGLTWRVVRINEDGTIKIMMQDSLNNKKYVFNPSHDNYIYFYYSESNIEGGIKKIVDDWYSSTLETNYDNYVVTTNFCEAAKVKNSSAYTSGNATMELSKNYNYNFECPPDGNGKQYVSAKAGIITADEVAMAGIPLYGSNQPYVTNTYLQHNNWWTMSPSGFSESNGQALVWFVFTDGYINPNFSTQSLFYVRPVISLKSDVTVTGTGASDDMWVVQ